MKEWCNNCGEVETNDNRCPICREKKLSKIPLKQADKEPCPFCGNEPEIVKYPDGSGHIGCINHDKYTSIWCSWGNGRTEKEALAEWNRRAEPLLPRNGGGE